MAEQQIVLFRVSYSGVFQQREATNLDEINALLRDGWRVVSVSPTSSPSTNVGSMTDVFALVVLER
jgi:hypothetical protein